MPNTPSRLFVCFRKGQSNKIMHTIKTSFVKGKKPNRTDNVVMPICLSVYQTSN